MSPQILKIQLVAKEMAFLCPLIRDSESDILIIIRSNYLCQYLELWQLVILPNLSTYHQFITDLKIKKSFLDNIALKDRVEKCEISCALTSPKNCGYALPGGFSLTGP